MEEMRKRKRRYIHEPSEIAACSKVPDIDLSLRKPVQSHITWKNRIPEVKEKVREEIEKVETLFNSRPHLFKQFKAQRAKLK